MSKSILGAWGIAIVAGSVALLGCGGSSSSGTGPKTFAVSGVVTQGGNPVEGATVTFMPEGGKKGAAGVTDKNGRYTLSSSKPGDGALPGTYKVTITKYEAASGEATTGFTKNSNSRKPSAGPKNLLPVKYAKPETSNLTATVKDGGDKNLDFKVD